jgi:hypothetical protein
MQHEVLRIHRFVEILRKKRKKQMKSLADRCEKEVGELLEPPGFKFVFAQELQGQQLYPASRREEEMK